MIGKYELEGIRRVLTQGQLPERKFWRLRYEKTGRWVVMIPWVNDRLKALGSLPERPSESDVLYLVAQILQSDAYLLSPKNLSDLITSLSTLIRAVRQWAGPSSPPAAQAR